MGRKSAYGWYSNVEPIVGDSPKPRDEMIATFRKVRKLRNKPTHVDVGNVFDPAIEFQQRYLMEAVYTVMRTLRLLLLNHPRARRIEVDDSLSEAVKRDPNRRAWSGGPSTSIAPPRPVTSTERAQDAAEAPRC